MYHREKKLRLFDNKNVLFTFYVLSFITFFYSRIDCRSRARPWNRFCHMTREEADHQEWRAMVDYWAGSSE